MAKRKTTRKKAAKPTRKKATKSGSTQKLTKKTRKPTPATGKASKKKTTRKSGVTGKKSKKIAAATTSRKVSRKRTLKRATKNKESAKAAKKRSAVATPEPEAPAVKPEPQEPGLPLKEVRARLGLIGPQIADLDWLEGLYLYGPALLEVPRLERVDFIVVHRGRRGANRLKAAERELRTLLEAVLPLDFELNTGTPLVGRLLSERNPAAIAHLGHAEPVFNRSV